jgi:hypothetical protein
MVWLYRSRVPVGKRAVFYSFKLFLPAIAPLWWNSEGLLCSGHFKLARLRRVCCTPGGGHAALWLKYGEMKKVSLTCLLQLICPPLPTIRESVLNRLNMELDLQSLYGLHVYSCTHWLRPRNSPRIWAHIRERYWSAKIDNISSLPPCTGLTAEGVVDSFPQYFNI